MLSFINPDIYHGTKKKKDFFEGWYFKIVQPKTEEVFSFIPGIIFSKDPQYSHSFIQVLQGKNTAYNYIKYTTESFKAATNNFNIQIEESHFSLNGINLKINNSETNICGELKFSNIIKWPDNIINPGSMGFYNYLTFMQCYSQVCALDGVVSGILNINGRNIDFTGGRVYIEKNWGRDFPYSYVWAQCNTFSSVSASLTCSIAHIPFSFTSFTGFLVGLYVKGKFYEFSTINRSKLNLRFGDGELSAAINNGKYTLSFHTVCQSDMFMTLFAPKAEKMHQIARETLTGKVIVLLIKNRTEEVIFKDTGHLAGVEYCGNYKDLSRE
jgi:tocopherol cyclase